jgi:DNA repair protein RecO (recombination protein O)
VSVERASGVVLRTRLLTETSLIVHWLTEEHGRLATVAKGARRPKSPFRGKLDLFHEAEFSFQRSRRSDLHTLRELVVIHTHPALRTRLENLRQAAYGTSLIEAAAEPETAVPTLHGLSVEFLDCLDRGGASPWLVLAFELKVLEASGLAPDLDRSRLSEVGRALARTLGTQPLAEAPRVSATFAQLTEMDRFLHSFLAWHLERIPRGRQAALETIPAAAQPPHPRPQPPDRRPQTPDPRPQPPDPSPQPPGTGRS